MSSCDIEALLGLALLGKCVLANELGAFIPSS